jgi:hypothetical protein
METNIISIISIIFSISTFLSLAIVKFFKKRVKEKPNNETKVFNNGTKVRFEYKENFLFDPFEIKILYFFLENMNENGIEIDTVNGVLNLNKLQKENQRQRRHIFFREINLKLHLILGNREVFARLPLESDRRLKNYILNCDEDDKNKLIEILNSRRVNSTE